jgi:hypothetical protein
MYVCMYVCVCICMCTSVYVYVYVYVYVKVSQASKARMVLLRRCMYVCIVCISDSIYIYIYIYMMKNITDLLGSIIHAYIYIYICWTKLHTSRLHQTCLHTHTNIWWKHVTRLKAPSDMTTHTHKHMMETYYHTPQGSIRHVYIHTHTNIWWKHITHLKAP